MEMPKKLWFKAKDYGWGWQPSSWEGWLVLAIYIIFIIKVFWGVDQASRLRSDVPVKPFLLLFLSTVILIIVCYLKGEKPEWRWGKKK